MIIDRFGCFVPGLNGDIYQLDGHGTIVLTNNEQRIVNVALSGKLPDGAELSDKAIKLRPGE
jgi:hypothetical protein